MCIDKVPCSKCPVIRDESAYWNFYNARVLVKLQCRLLVQVMWRMMEHLGDLPKNDFKVLFFIVAITHSVF